MHAYELDGTRILEFSVNDAEVSAALDSSALISLAIEHRAGLVILPASEVGNGFFQLKTGVAGDLIQKFVNYRLRLAIIGDVQLTPSKVLPCAPSSPSLIEEEHYGSPQRQPICTHGCPWSETEAAAPRMRHLQMCG